MLIDTHAHVNFRAFNHDFDEVIKRSLGEDVWMINVGSKYETSKKAVEIAGKYSKGVYATIGLHPIHAEDEQFDPKKYKELALSGNKGDENKKLEKVVAIGEIGLDYFKNYGEFKDKQKRIFLQQLDLARELDLPVIIHCRMAHQNLYEILKLKIKSQKLKINGVIHCFTGDWEQAKKYLNLGFYLGINGIMYKFDLKEVIKKAPLEKILLETDCPYLGKEERNEPVFVRQIAKEIARIKNISFNEVAQITTQNAQTFFAI